MHSSKTHTHTASPTVFHPKGGNIVADPVPGSTWERVRKILLIPLCIVTVLTFIAGVGLYIAATWGSGEGWFEKAPLVNLDEKAQTIGPGQPDVFPQEKLLVRESGQFQFKAPSVHERPPPQT